MKPPAFAYCAPRSVAEAVETLGGAGGGAKVLAGGQSLLPILNMRLAAPPVLVDINRVPTLATISINDGVVTLGATARHAAVERDAAVAAALPLLRQALRLVAHPAIRNRGTVCGSLAHADPAAELPAVLALTGGHVLARSARGTRTVPADELFVGPLQSSLAPDELLTEARFPRSPAGTATTRSPGSPPRSPPPARTGPGGRGWRW